MTSNIVSMLQESGIAVLGTADMMIVNTGITLIISLFMAFTLTTLVKHPFSFSIGALLGLFVAYFYKLFPLWGVAICSLLYLIYLIVVNSNLIHWFSER